MRCSKAKKLISQFVDGELAGSDAAEIRSHLAACGECRREERALRATMQSLDEWSSVETRLGYDAFLNRVDESRNLEIYHQRESWFAVPRWAAGAMATASIVAGVFLGISTGTQLAPAEPVSQQQVVRAMDFHVFDNVVEASFTSAAESESLDYTEGGLSQ